VDIGTFGQLDRSVVAQGVFWSRSLALSRLRLVVCLGVLIAICRACTNCVVVSEPLRCNQSK
jgi:hypothetical protein